MIVIEIAPNRNCDPVDMRVFNETGPARGLVQMQLEREPGRPVWCDVTGWTADNAVCRAVVHKVDDSGEGVALLIHGGDAGLRFRPADTHEAWDINNKQQWGESFIITTDENDLRFAPD